ncbi:MAG: hypothetical protein WCD37_06490 [Chloroflexia bacterium]
MRAISLRVISMCAALLVLAACAGPLEIPPTPTPNPGAAAATSNHQHGEGGADNARLITRYGGPVAVTLATAPAGPRPGETFSIAYTLKDGAGAAMPPERLAIAHEKLMHLILVSQDLGSFQHLHPASQGEGVYATETSVSLAGKYVLFDEFVTAEGTTQIERHVVATEGADEADTPAMLSATLGELQEWGDLRATLTTGAPRIRRRLPTGFLMNVVTKDGQPVTDMQPWLGAPCHIVIVSADTKQFAHTHGDVPGGSMSGDMGTMGNMAMPTPPAQFGPRLAFTHTFMQPGPYRVWVQFTYQGEVATFGFNVVVEK